MKQFQPHFNTDRRLDISIILEIRNRNWNKPVIFMRKRIDLWKKSEFLYGLCEERDLSQARVQNIPLLGN